MCKRPISLLAIAIPLLLVAQDFRATSDLVRVTAVVKNAQGGLVGTLQKDDFEVYDNGVKQQVAQFERQTEQPLSIALLIDTSGSTGIALKYETESALKFFKAVLNEGNPQDRVALYNFDYEVVQGPFTRNQLDLERRLRLLHSQAGTSMYDAIYFASRALEDRDGRKVLVIISDGGDTVSAHDSHAALKQAQLADAVIYPIVVMPITNPAGRNIGGENVLTILAEGTGGRTFFPNDAKDLDTVFRDLLAELRTQYFLGFQPKGVPPTSDPFHKLEVRVNTPGLRVSARNGYYGESSGSAPGDARPNIAPARKKEK